jgi:16S rRNA (guanine527-N7)-methyltransferase
VSQDPQRGLSEVANGALERLIQERSGFAHLSVSREVTSGLAQYWEVLAHWNRRINLTGFDLGQPTAAAIDRLLIEPLGATEFIPPEAGLICDVGSGGGSPALPMRIAVSAGRWVLVEARAKKAAFLREAIRVLRLQDVTVLTAEFAAVAANPSYRARVDVLTMRAVRADSSLWRAILEALAPGSRVIWFAGLRERSGAPASMDVISQRDTFVVLARPS